jgi:iron only hydrogenase large subunit-like protein
VLLQHQSVAEFSARLRDGAVAVVVSVSPQSYAALATRLQVPLTQACDALHSLLARAGVRAVFDTAVCRELSLLETAAELVARLTGAPGSGPLPLLASACPGWVCYAEKSCPQVLPHLSRVKSPQAVTGTLVKRMWAHRQGLHAGRVYHASIAPCYDKKLEASRDDFTTEAEDVAAAAPSIPETDCVLTTGEVWTELMLSAPPTAAGGACQLPWLAVDAASGQPFNAPGGGSGGYADAAARGAAAALWGVHIPADTPLPWAHVRNADFLELEMQPPPGASGRALRFAAVYGFRNIQSVVRQMKKGACNYDYVEVMACPGGCLNGGGQGAPPPGMTPQQALAAAGEVYAQAQVRLPGSHPLVGDVYAWLGGGVGSPEAARALHTQFHVREKTVTAVLNNW